MSVRSDSYEPDDFTLDILRGLLQRRVDDEKAMREILREHMRWEVRRLLKLTERQLEERIDAA